MVKSAVAAGFGAQGLGKILQIVVGLSHNLAEFLDHRFGIIFVLTVCCLIAAVQDKQGRWPSISSLTRVFDAFDRSARAQGPDSRSM